MDLQTRQIKMISSVFYGCMFFIITTVLAMFLYTGGNVENPNALHYDFLRNFFSELGKTTDHKGESNLIPFILFSASAIIAGLGLFPFFLALPAFFMEHKGERILSLIASSFAMPISVAYIGIGFAPADLYPYLHGVFVFVAFTGTVPIILIYTILFLRNPIFPRYLCYIYIFFLVITFLYMLTLYIGIDSLIFKVVAQKVIIYTEMFSMAIAGLILSKVAEKEIKKKIRMFHKPNIECFWFSPLNG